MFVQSSDGNTGTRNPAALGGGATDAHLIYEGLSRVAADGVLAGAETIRGSSVIFSVWRTEVIELRAALRLPRHPIQIVATLGGLTFDDTLLFNVPELPVVVIAPLVLVEGMHDKLARLPWIRTIAMAGRMSCGRISRLRSMGIARIRISAAAQSAKMIDAGLIQDPDDIAAPAEKLNTPLSEAHCRPDGRQETWDGGRNGGRVRTFGHLVIWSFDH